MKKVHLYILSLGIICSGCSQGSSFWYVYPEYPPAAGSGWDGPGVYRGQSWFDSEEEFLQWREENRARSAHLWENRYEQTDTNDE